MNSETHYLTYDPDAIWKEMITAYVNAGGDILYPGDEKEMLLRGVLSIITQVFAGVDAALRMDTLRYAVGEYLDIYGEKRGCVRIPAAAASCTAEIIFRDGSSAKTIPAGTALTADGQLVYLLAEAIEYTGNAQTVTAEIVCRDTGGAGNGLLAGTQMQFIVPIPSVVSVHATMDASGGQAAEADDAYRERIRIHGLTANTTGSRAQYESLAKAVSSEILDARAAENGPGYVGVYLLLASDVGADAIVGQVTTALSADTVRPLTDIVEVYIADYSPYTLNVQYAAEEGSNIAPAVQAAVEEYQQWQDTKLGRAFNPDRLMAMIYQAGAVRVKWGDGSHFAGGAVEYTVTGFMSHCKGSITVSVM